ncbi:MAG TPA: hypothetical protein VN455_04160 [Methanotrichaceae archaeon]|nr:hypothetical protein [Methanotrichaceae archaeon]
MTSSLGASLEASTAEPGNSPLYDYRYNQAAEELGLLNNGSSESKLSYGSIETASLNPEDTGVEERLTTKSSDPEEENGPIFDMTVRGCQDIPTMGKNTCSSTCVGTCSNTCNSITCGGATSCGGVNTCSNTCGSTCAASCGRTCSNTCGSTCGSTCMASCGRTCSRTCEDTCGGTCGYTCYSTCRSSCGYTCAATCASTCGYTCASTCRSTCGYTCSYTCASTCAQTCSATCGSKCTPAPVAPVVNAPLADYTTRSPRPAEQNAILSYDEEYAPPEYVYYKGVNTQWAAFDRSFAGNYLLAWVKTQDNSWSVVARTPLGSWVQEVIYVPVSGDLTMSSISPGGLTDSKYYGRATPGYKYVWFYAGMPGTYGGIFSIGGVRSNQITLFAY